MCKRETLTESNGRHTLTAKTLTITFGCDVVIVVTEPGIGNECLFLSGIISFQTIGLE